jgi:uncharacterized protein (TIGR00369 family)
VPTSADDPAVRARVQGVLDIALHRFLRVTLLDPAEPARGIAFPVEEAALNNAGVLHGGIVTALLDVACYLTLLPDLGAEENAVTHDVTASLMRAVPRGARVQVRGSVVRRGRSIVFLRAEATVAGAVVAAGQVTKTLVRPNA